MSINKISVIMPAFNASRYITSAVTSIMNQTLNQIEIIIVNDGSTDNTLQQLELLSKKDSRIKIINQKNQSVGVARTNGVLSATGEFIAFIDSDDSFEPNMLECMYKEAKNKEKDIVICGYNDVDIKGNILKSHIFKSKKVTFSNILQLQINPATWNKIFKRELFIENDICFAPNIFCEDLSTTLELFYFAKKIGFIEQPLYNYLINPTGASQVIKPKNIDDIFFALNVNKNFLKRHCLLEKYNLDFYKRICLEIANIARQISKVKSSQEELYQHLFDNILENDFLSIDRKSIKKIFHTDRNIYFKLLSYQIYLRGLDSVYIYGCGEPFRDVVDMFQFLGIKIEGVIETESKENDIPFKYGTLETLKNELSYRNIFIISITHFDTIHQKIITFQKNNNIQLNVF